MKKKVRNLLVGDVLSSGTKIIEKPYDSVRCPKGKCNIGLQYPSGAVRTSQWNKETIVTLSKEPYTQNPVDRNVFVTHKELQGY